jgi:hypothetical protein
VSHPPRDPKAKTSTAPGLHGDVTAALRTLGVAVTAEALDAALSAAEKQSLSHLEFLHRLLAGPAEARLQRALERRIHAARFQERTTLEGFDWEFNAKGLDRRSVEQLATCDFVRRHENVVLVGQTGLGKSRILQAVGHAACVQGYRVRYATSAKLLQEFTAALADGTCSGMLHDYFDAHYPYLLPEGRYHRFGGSPTDIRQHAMIEMLVTLDMSHVSRDEVAFAARAYDDCVADLDEQIGRLTDRLDRDGVLDRTWLIIVADHGESFGEHSDIFRHGVSLYQTEVHVPLLIIPPGGGAHQTCHHRGR